MAAAALANIAARVTTRPRAKTGPRLATPPKPFHFVQDIDNSRVRRVADPREIRVLLSYLTAGTFVFVAALLFAWQQFAIIRDGYDIADLKSRRDTLVEENKILDSQVATLRNPERVSNYALASLGLAQPKQGQVIRLDTPLPAAEGEPVLARLHPYGGKP
jgi:hypothetical protein